MLVSAITVPQDVGMKFNDLKYVLFRARVPFETIPNANSSEDKMLALNVQIKRTALRPDLWCRLIDLKGNVISL